MEEKAKMLLNQHDCSFIAMLSECRVLWKNRNGIIRDNDIAVLSNMSENAWKYWETA